MTPDITLESMAERCFQVAAEFRPVRRTAAALNVSPSVLGRRVTGLEQSPEVMLFGRLSRGLRMTCGGEILLYRAARRRTSRLPAIRNCLRWCPERARSVAAGCRQIPGRLAPWAAISLIEACRPFSRIRFQRNVRASAFSIAGLRPQSTEKPCPEWPCSEIKHNNKTLNSGPNRMLVNLTTSD
jgi:hypothetical protein